MINIGLIKELAVWKICADYSNAEPQHQLATKLAYAAAVHPWHEPWHVGGAPAGDHNLEQQARKKLEGKKMKRKHQND